MRPSNSVPPRSGPLWPLTESNNTSQSPGLAALLVGGRRQTASVIAGICITIASGHRDMELINNENISIARLKQNSSGALMAQTNTVSVFVQMTAVTASGVADRPEDCSKLLLQWLRSSFCQVLFLSCPSDCSEAAGHSRSKMSSARHRGDRHTVSSQVWWRQSVQTLIVVPMLELAEHVLLCYAAIIGFIPAVTTTHLSPALYCCC